MTDEDSFKKGVGILEGFPKLLGKAAMGAVGLGVAFVGLGASTANAMTKLAATAKQLGMNAMTLDNWQNAVRLAGGDADSFTSSIQTMNEAFRNLKIGEVKEDFIKATGMSGADFSKLQGMNNDQRLRTIWSALEKVQDPGKQQALIQKIFGQGGVDLFSRMQLQGTSLGALYSQAAGMNPNTQADYDAAVKGNKANESIIISFDNTIKKLGIEIEKALLPGLDTFAKWLIDNKDSLTAFAVAIGDATDVIMGVIGDFSKGLGVIGARSDFAKNVLPSGPAGTMDRISLLTGIGTTSDIWTEFYTKKYTIDQAKAVFGSDTRKNLLESGFPSEAFKLSDAAISALETLAKQAELKQRGSMTPEGIREREKSMMFRQVIDLNIKTDGPITQKQADAIGDAFSKAILASNTMPVRQ